MVLHRKVVAYYQILCGVMCAIYLNQTIVNLVDFSLGALIVLFLVAFNFVAGAALLYNKSLGFWLSCVNQIIQIPALNVFGVAYIYFSFLHFGVYFNSIGELSWSFFMSSYFLFNPNADTSVISIGVNVFPIVVIYFLRKVGAGPAFKGDSSLAS